MLEIATTTGHPVENTRARVLTQAVVETARRLELGSTDLRHIIGTSQPSASRLLNGKLALREGGKEWELSTHLVRLYRSLASLVGGNDELAREWLRSPNRALGDETPIKAIRRVEGLLHACEYLDAHRARV
ncbi:MbcA/ParS/Xre antitoxin family protein [Dokdonella sp. MW10]|uniref:MbcA/ParS/Xre antitoxin family protein n=1 Tax=Dokdonella sp. MW10 TaxID=2992926 RepID=UPI003F815249